jgi:hypothetical protein
VLLPQFSFPLSLSLLLAVGQSPHLSLFASHVMQLFAPTTLFGMSSAPLMVHWTQARAKIRLGAIVPLFLLAVAFVSLPLLHSQWPNGRLPDHHGALEGTLPFSKLDDLCTIDEWQRGSWTLRPPDELQRLASAETYAAFLELQQFRCHWAVPEYSCNGDEALPRVQQAAQWSWQVGGCRLAPLDPSTIVRHLLEHGGWFFVGGKRSAIRRQAQAYPVALQNLRPGSKW